MLKSKQKIIIIIVLFILIGITSVGVIFRMKFFPNIFAEKISSEKISDGTESIMGESDILVAYFSLEGNRVQPSGDVDVVGSASLVVRDGKGFGHAEYIAITVQKITEADIHFIEVTEKYPDNYMDTIERHRNESMNDILPELATHLNNIDDYNIVILIYPTWMGKLPQAVLTFLQEYNFTGKIVVPIATSQAVGLGSSVNQIESTCPETMVLMGLSAGSDKDVSNYLYEIGLHK